MGLQRMLATPETKILDLQSNILETLSVMMHHDAITGTHRKAVGADYRKMMQAQRNALMAIGDHPLATEILGVAKRHGITIRGLNECTFEGHTLICE